MRTYLLILLMLNFSAAFGQNDFRALILDSETREPLPGASVFVEGTNLGNSSDAEGKVEITGIPDGSFTLVFRYIGYRQLSEKFSFPSDRNEVTILLESMSEEIEEVIISSTRSSRTIENIPTRVESISGEELEEKGNMKPGDIRMMLNESTGIQTQQTSATSYNSSIRIQGLDGRYTQLLRDGFPLFGGYSGGLSLLQIVPLDLRQVEVIKGASSTLYGGGAIAGLVNLISRVPEEETELNFLLNGTSALGLDASGFYSQKYGKTGATVFASYNSGNPYDPSGIGLTAIPEFRRVTINPKLFVYFGESTVLSAGFNSTFEDRIGGDIRYIEGNGDENHSYFENNRTNRLSTQVGLISSLNDRMKLNLKNSLGYYYRTIELPDFTFGGTQYTSFSEATLNISGSRLEWIGGVNFVTDNFSQDSNEGTGTFNYRHTTLGGFIQNTWNITEAFNVESGIRADYQDDYGFFALPRLSMLWKVNDKISLRAGGGMGYKIPTVFTEDAERIHFENIRPMNFAELKAEKSAGGNFDLNYKTPLTDEIFFSINSLLFYTMIDNPLVLSSVEGEYFYEQPDGFIDTKGIETNVKLSFGDFRLFLGYTLADVKQHFNGGVSEYPLVARHRMNNVLMYEIEEKLRVGLEAYYFSKQTLNDLSAGKEHWIFGLMVEKMWEKFSLFVNFENITDTRQTRFDTIFTGPVTDPVFRDIYAPVDGFVINGGLKIRVF